MNACDACGHSNPNDAVFCGRCGSPIESIDGGSLFRPGDVVGAGRYRIEMLLGEGGMGFVYKATDLTLERVVALKFLHPELTAHPTARRRMAQEARVLARIEHPNVIQVRNVFEEGELLAMDLEFLPGGDLLGRLRQGALPESDAINVTIKILAGLDALHKAGLVHRDIKPENILLTANGAPKITDLGVARDPNAREKTQLGATLGTPEYMSPEQIQGEVVDHRSDLYAVGILLFQLCTGKLPFSAKSDFDWQAAHVQQAPAMGSLRQRVSPELVAAVQRALAKTPETRWQNARDMARGLRTARPQEGARSFETSATAARAGPAPSSSKVIVSEFSDHTRRENTQPGPHREPTAPHRALAPVDATSRHTSPSEAPAPPTVPSHLGQAIAVTLCCCQPLGVVAIIYAGQVSPKLAAGDYDGAVAASRAANLWGYISVGAGVLLYVFISLVSFLSEFSRI